ncbi:MarR family winged helix-turn-helix transcriptional regulator [Demequina iriomotensis]|uniref:MarR family winged helix-turn-helix transcriptional regulator n=1 Tax=Demequina iriomotensis TaxID=1536641 RepID=UPI000780505D|nr:MarR family winged helix-turn-helix transcriptional regulator [Demequina iriomotensis]
MEQDADLARLAEATAFAETMASLWALSTYISRTTSALPTLPPAQASALRRIVAAGSAGVTPSDLAAAMGVSRAMVSDHIRKLQAHGLVARRRADGDGRSAIVSVTAHGLEVHRSFHSGLALAVAEAFSTLPHEDLERITRAEESFTRLKEHLTAIADRVGAAGEAAEGPSAAPAS